MVCYNQSNEKASQFVCQIPLQPSPKANQWSFLMQLLAGTKTNLPLGSNEKEEEEENGHFWSQHLPC